MVDWQKTSQEMQPRPVEWQYFAVGMNESSISKDDGQLPEYVVHSVGKNLLSNTQNHVSKS